MPIKKVVDRSKDLCTFTCYGELSIEEIILTLMKFYQGVEGQPTRKVLWDMSNATSDKISMHDMDEIVALRMNNEGIVSRGRTAIVAPEDANFGLARVFELRTTGTNRDLLVFRTYEDAAKWIEKE